MTPENLYRDTTIMEQDTATIMELLRWCKANTKTYTQSVLCVASSRGLNLRIVRPPLVRLVQCFRERRKTHQVVGHFAISCVGWSPGRTPWQATNTRHEPLVSQLLRVLLQTHINWTFVLCVSQEEPFARRGEKKGSCESSARCGRA